ncbi:MAG TPA: diguanylate cyclase [Candidatus Tectomicrobia bacterium]|nr:diguanylate cyclase [Candidatus Tectomicrobia bacterium]
MKVLIAEDDTVSRRLLEVTLTRWGYEVAVTRDGVEAWEVLQGLDAPPLAILDWMMPGMDGVEVCRKVRQRGQEPYTYLLLLTTKGRKENIIEGLAAGADDYVTKPFDPPELQVRLRTGKRIMTLQAELIEAREALRIQATHDPLTGLWNRSAILEILGNELVRSRREAVPVAAVIADLDHFKRINDTYGHLVGDTALCEAVGRMRALLRPYDAMGRYGGEEFLMVLPGCTSQDAFRLAERIRSGIGQEPVKIPAGMIDLTSSMGVAASDAIATLHASALILAADTALYRAKARGRNRVELATETDMTASLVSANSVPHT